MDSYRIRLDLLKLQGAMVKKIKLDNKVSNYLIVPIDNADGFYLGAKGCYLNLRATPLQNKKFEDSHCVRVMLSKERMQSLTRDELIKQVPIIGGMQVNEYQPQQMEVTEMIDASQFIAEPIEQPQTQPYQQPQQTTMFVTDNGNVANDMPF